MIIKAWYDFCSDYYLVYWDGKQWVKDIASAKQYKSESAVDRLLSKFHKSVYQMDNNIHSVSVR